MSIYLGGSRKLGQCPQLAPLVSAAQAAGHQIHVGCCIGADQQVIQAARPSSLVVFAQFAQRGTGAWSGSAVQAVSQAGRAGALVCWLAGGPLSVPLAARLIRRSWFALEFCESAVFFSPGPGSLAVAAHAVQSSIPVFAIGEKPQAIPGQAGQWVFNYLVIGQQTIQAWQFQPAQIGLF